MRTIFCGVFLGIGILELLTGGDKAFKTYPLLYDAANSDISTGTIYSVYTTFQIFLLIEMVLFVHVMYLATGVIYQKPEWIKTFLVCHLLTWLGETFSLFILCLIHQILLGWYLIMLMVIILELYGFIIAYSYYHELMARPPCYKHNSYFGSCVNVRPGTCNSDKFDCKIQDKMAFEFPRVAKCCFCVPLRIGSLLIGYFSILVSCMTISAISFYTYKVSDYVKENDKHPQHDHTPEEVRKVAISLYISFGYYILVFLYNLVINVLLVVGVHMNKPQYLKLYINTAYFLLALAISLTILTCVFMGFVATIPMLKWAVTIVFCIIIVRSTYLEMEERNKPKAFEMQNLYMPQRAPLMV